MTAERIVSAPQSAELNKPVRQLSPIEAEALVQCAEALQGLDIAEQTEWYCQAARRAARKLPDSLLNLLEEFNDHGSSTGILVLRGAEVGPVPPTPPDNTKMTGRHTLLARESAVLIESIAKLVAYQAEAHGAPQQDMVPNREKQFTQESQGSRVTLEAHTEQCFSDLKPDFVILSCLRGDPNAATYSFTARQLMDHLSRDEVAILRQPLWTTLIDSSFQPYVPHPQQVRGPYPILAGPEGNPSILIDQDLMHGVTSAAQDLLKKVIGIYEQHHNSHVLQRGDILLLDNRHAMHGRSAFRPQFDGGDRFIVRSMALRDLHPSAYARHGRLILAEHS